MRQEWKKRGGRRWILGLLVLPMLAACRRKAPAAADAAPGDAADGERQELVLQPSDSWKPEDVPRKLTIQLIAETGLVKGREFRYRMEIKNVGREPIDFKEGAPSFIKSGSLCGPSGFRFYVTPPGGTEQALECGDDASVSASTETLDLTLKSGEYLLTRADGLGDRSRALRTKFRFDQNGAYRIRAAYSVPGLSAESNTIVAEAASEKKKAIRPGVVVSSPAASAVPAGGSRE